ncbi:hypothetical protein [Sulfurimonas sp.]|uniref:hypothetical protein n=1 Tax=Sulfurimonas sp. TaxID=2022749 RepID=UPI0019DF4A90|nr:hypothetical protein [Sulfurimonas sp.]MBE0515598.1 hypothetical protein [Sulfurimonas sp.]
MTEKEIVEMMYQKHQKLFLNATEASLEWGSSYSSLSKLFGGKDALPEAVILEKNIIPQWVMVGNKRMWKLTDIAEWILNTEIR